MQQTKEQVSPGQRESEALVRSVVGYESYSVFGYGVAVIAARQPVRFRQIWLLLQ